MKSRFWPRVDLHAFHWRLEPLHGKLRTDLDAAQHALAVLLREEKELGQALRAADEQFLEQAKHILKSPLQPQNRACSLQYMVERGREIDACREQAANLRSRVTAARESCMAAERRLASIETLRGNAQAAFAQDQARADAREADMGWLANRYRGRLRSRPGGEIP